MSGISEQRVNNIASCRAKLGQPRSFDAIRRRSKELGLDRVASKQVIVGGTNGKGSTATALQQLLTSSGYKVGISTSPHLMSYHERIAIDGVSISEADCLAAIEAVDRATEGVVLTYFDISTLAALWYFREETVDIAIVEVGLGGRLDCANVIDPDVSILTNIGLDHQKVLGDTLSDIALEKIPISRPNRPLVYGQAPGVKEVHDYVLQQGVKLFHKDQEFGVDADGAGWVSTPQGTDTVEYGYEHDAISESKLMAMQVSVLLDNSLSLAQLATVDVQSPLGRYQALEGLGRCWLLDVAHNPEAIVHLRRQLFTQGIEEFDVVFGCLQDKNPANMLRSLTDPNIKDASWVRELYCVKTSEPRGVDLRPYVSQVETNKTRFFDSISTALSELSQHTHSPTRTTVVCGSFIVIADALRFFKNHPMKDSRSWK